MRARRAVIRTGGAVGGDLRGEGGQRLVDRVVHGDQLGDTGDGDHAHEAFGDARDPERTACRLRGLQQDDERGEAGRVDEVHLLHVQDEVRSALVHHGLCPGTQLGRGVQIDISDDGDDGRTVAGEADRGIEGIGHV